MTDRELLEAAAKAVGKTIVGWNSQHGGAEVAVLAGGNFWQPLHENHLTDCMGDALRLAVALGIGVQCHVYNGSGYVLAQRGQGENEAFALSIEPPDDPAAATRRAIVRAAAVAAHPKLRDLGRMILRDCRKLAAEAAPSLSAAADLLQHDDQRLTLAHYRRGVVPLKTVR